MTKRDLLNKLRVLEVDEQTRKNVTCSLIGHSRIVSMCLGYVSCGRCGDQIGDTLGGVFDLCNRVVVGHNCEKCQENFKALKWQDKIFVADPFTSMESLANAA